MSIEAGGRVVSTDWVETRAESTRYSFDVTAAMAPNAYAHVSLLQPHMQTANDLPIRLYGILPIPVEDPKTRLRPVVSVPEVLRPEETATISVSEAGGRAMAYTLALVDEGLLGLTRFRTPDPWAHFYSKAATAVSTWDLYDLVAAAWGGTLEQMLAVGGSEELEAGGRRKADRFPPMVRFLGPFELAKGEKKSHAIPIPQYVGAVRVMCIAATRDGAYGRAEQEVPVRKPLMVLADLPRVLSVGEEVVLPVSVFALEARVRDVTVELDVQGALAPLGEAGRGLRFAEPGDQLVTFRLRAAKAPGLGRITVRGSSGPERAVHTIEIDVRVPSEPVTDVSRGEVRPGGRWTVDARPIGLPGTNRMTLEVSRIPPLDLERRLRYLITYPHGCVEQTTSTAFAQLFLDRLVELGPERSKEVQTNVTTALERIARFQTQSGGFAFWLGNPEPDPWATSYAGHFVVEADKRGYAVPPAVLAKWKEHQADRALSWSGGAPAHAEREALQQAYRLYTLALAGQPALGAMNRLREAQGPQRAGPLAAGRGLPPGGADGCGPAPGRRPRRTHPDVPRVRRHLRLGYPRQGHDPGRGRRHGPHGAGRGPACRHLGRPQRRQAAGHAVRRLRPVSRSAFRGGGGSGAVDAVRLAVGGRKRAGGHVARADRPGHAGAGARHGAAAGGAGHRRSAPLCATGE